MAERVLSWLIYRRFQTAILVRTVSLWLAKTCFVILVKSVVACSIFVSTSTFMDSLLVTVAKLWTLLTFSYSQVLDEIAGGYSSTWHITLICFRLAPWLKSRRSLRSHLWVSASGGCLKRSMLKSPRSKMFVLLSVTLSVMFIKSSGQPWDDTGFLYTYPTSNVFLESFISTQMHSIA